MSTIAVAHKLIFIEGPEVHVIVILEITFTMCLVYIIHLAYVHTSLSTD